MSERAPVEQFTAQVGAAHADYREKLKSRSFVIPYLISAALCVVIVGIPLLVLVSWLRRRYRSNARDALVRRVRQLTRHAEAEGLRPEVADDIVAGIAGKKVLAQVRDAEGEVLHAVRLPEGEPEMPWVCVVTGRPADVSEPVQAFSWKPIAAAGGAIAFAAWQFRRVPIQLPFSHEGLALYKRKRPAFDKIKEAGLIVASVIPLLPVDVIWLLFCHGALFWLPALDRLRGRRRLCKASVRPWQDGKGLHHVIQVPSDVFVDELLAANPEAREDLTDVQVRDQAVKLTCGGVVEDQGFCTKCWEDTPHRRGGCNHLLHGLLTPVTFGLWFIVWLPMVFRTSKWRCTRCGRRVRALDQAPKEAPAPAEAAP
jgi:hypothetical protein